MRGRIVGAVVCLWGATACGDNLVGAPPDGFKPRVPTEVTPTVGYPDPPAGGEYGGNEGDVLPNMTFAGYLTSSPELGPVTGLEYKESITLEDVRQLEGYTHMLLTVAAEWCKPCREEAEILPELFDAWAKRGGYVLSVINQDRLYNTADKRAVDAWGKRYATNYTLTHDPEGWIANFLNPSTVPLNVVVDLETMTVLRSRVGEDRDTFRFFEQQLDQ
ncbi:MAG: redoxin domain-containing protein [Myxococcota bacterium]